MFTLVRERYLITTWYYPHLRGIKVDYRPRRQNDWTFRISDYPLLLQSSLTLVRVTFTMSSEQYGPPPARSNQGHIVCNGCTTTLVYPLSAHRVRCTRCGHVTPAPAQLYCSGCSTLLLYPRGASRVHCQVCGTLTSTQQVPSTSYATVICGGCRAQLRYTTPARCVQCAVCNHVTTTPQQNMHHHNHNHNQQQQPLHHSASNNSFNDSFTSTAGAYNASSIGLSSQGTAEGIEAVLIENPPTIDEDGNEISNINLGIYSRAEVAR